MTLVMGYGTLIRPHGSHATCSYGRTAVKTTGERELRWTMQLQKHRLGITAPR